MNKTGTKKQGMLNVANTQLKPKTVAILSYHKIGEPAPGGWKTWFYIPEETFARQLEFIRIDGWEVIDLASFLRGLTDPDTLPERTSLITFDDGYRSTLQVALPWLERFDYPAVLFMPTDYVGGRNTFDEGIEPEERMCDWDELCDLQRAGVSIQSHGASHRWFSKLTTVEQDKELTRSKAALEENLGSRVEIIAFPFGDPGDMLRESASSLRSAGYRAACMYGGGPVSLPTANPYHLSRLAMGPDTNLEIELAAKTQNVPPPSTLFDR